ncbi:DUF4233 domain-containing protein [Lacisediminihabitans profunda]|uniref:DUF4233 domain-containing protein n=1 Tax=Lacisediminihabitans profunda TaxID=2594790 RepID=A0A5C8US52_9MICO|nr:DUF4233 domain-containing protein [Lacisediminihabitans profunda]TXN31421.1 DUF4233 domain-containing protein [Lacisediminihabitans profunda]
MTAQPAAGRTRRARSATESLLSIVLLLEAVLVFFIALTAFGLRVLPAAAAFGGGAALLVALLVVGRLVRYRWGVWLGWLAQAVLLATGLLLPLMWFIGAVFAALWTYCAITGRRLDRRNALRRTVQNPTERTETTTTPDLPGTEESP